jgi:transcriptional regulator with XRE-family HTH domain
VNEDVQSIDEYEPRTSFAENLRRLIFFHHRSAKGAAELLGVSQHAISAWLTGKRPPRMQHLLRTALLYNFDLGALTSESLFVFARELARPERIAFAEAQLAHKRAMATLEGVEERGPGCER